MSDYVYVKFLWIFYLLYELIVQVAFLFYHYFFLYIKSYYMLCQLVIYGDDDDQLNKIDQNWLRALVFISDYLY